LLVSLAITCLPCFCLKRFAIAIVKMKVYIATTSYTRSWSTE
jgi:hypothetical protein